MEIVPIVPNRAHRLRSGAFLVLIAALGCHAQPPEKTVPVVQAGVALPPEIARRVEVMIRNRSQVTPDYTIIIGTPAASEVRGYDQLMISFSVDGKPGKPLPFLLSADGKTLAQFNKFDMSADLRTSVSDAGRPARGGPESAPVLVVVFDDLECPFCARLNAELFPAIPDRYKDQVRVVYRDFPLSQHPWAMHAAVDANCLVSASSAGYWNYVDYVHAHAGEMGYDDKSLATSEKQLDKLALDEGSRQGINQQELVACVLKQDATRVKASVAEGLADPLRLGSAPVLYINGEKVEGALPIQTIYDIIDHALIAEGRTPPPAASIPAQPAASGPSRPAASSIQATPAATKPGS
jgi:protein-disulfide isomerase